MKENRVGVVGIVIEEKGNINKVNQILHKHNSVIVGRMGLPHINGRDINVISIVVDGTTDEVGSLTGQLGIVEGVTTKSALSKKKFVPRSPCK